MKHAHKLFYVFIMFCFVLNCNAQCNATITANGPNEICSNRSLRLKAEITGTTWTQKNNFASTSRYGAISFSIGNKGYVGLGNDGADKNDFWEYDSNTDTWTQKADFAGVSRFGAVAFAIDNFGYVGTGTQNGSIFTNDFWEYDPIANNWTQKANFPGTARYAAVGFSLNSKGYLGTGYDGTFKNDFWEYNPSDDTWLQKSNVGGNVRSNAVAFCIGNKGYIATGTTGFYNKQDLWEYDPVNDTFIQKALFPGNPLSSAVGFSIGTKGYLVCGLSGNNINVATRTNEFWQYESLTDTWIQLPNYGGSPRHGATAFSINKKAYMSLGYNGGATNDVWEYNTDFNYAWSNGATTDTTTVDTSGTYSVTVSNSSGCLASASYSLTVNQVPSTSVGNLVNVTCNGAANGTVTITANGGTPGYSYYWQPGNMTTASVNNLTPGTYTCYVSDIKDCTHPEVITITEPSLSYSSQTITLFTGDSLIVGLNTYYDTGNYIDTLSNSNGCDSIVKTSVVFISASITSTSPFEVCSPDSIKLTANLVGLDWMPKANTIGSGRWGAVAFSIGNKGYMGTGYDAIGYTNDFWEYDPSNDIWTQKADFAGAARYNAVAFTIGNKGYLGTGYDVVNNRSNDFWEYDPTLNSWTQKASFGGTPRYEAAGFSIGNKGYIGTGYDGDSCRTDFWEYDPLIDVWTRKANFACVPRQSAIGFSLAGDGFIGCGHYGNINGIFLRNDIWEYNPTLDVWFETSVYPGSIGICQSVFTINDKAYVGLGYGPAGYSKDFWEFDLNNNEWTRLADFRGTGRYLAFGLSISGKGYFGTGYDGLSGNNSITKDFWEFDPELDYLWSTGDTTESIVVHNSGTYSVTLANFTGLNASTSQTVAVNPSPSLSVVSLNDAICNGSATGTVTMLATDGTPSYSYNWLPYGGSMSTASNLTAGSYTCSVTDVNNCTATEIVDILEPNYIGSSHSYTLCLGQVVTVGLNTYSTTGVYRDTLIAFNGCDSIITTTINYLPIDVTTSMVNNVITVNTSSATYQWIDCDTNIPIPGATNQSFTASANGNYAVVVTVNNCSDTSACVNINSVGLISSSSSGAVKIYPNPNNGVFTIELNSNSQLTVTTSIGEIILEKNLSPGKENINLEQLSSGVYFVHINNIDAQNIFKIIKK